MKRSAAWKKAVEEALKEYVRMKGQATSVLGLVTRVRPEGSDPRKRPVKRSVARKEAVCHM